MFSTIDEVRAYHRTYSRRTTWKKFSFDHEAYLDTQLSRIIAQAQQIGMNSLWMQFSDIVNDMKRRPYELLDLTRTTFDRDFLDFSVQITSLEAVIQVVLELSGC